MNIIKRKKFEFVILIVSLACSVLMGIVLPLNYSSGSNCSKNQQINLSTSNSGDWEPYIRKNAGDATNVFVADANNDGQNDIVTSNTDNDNVSIFCWNPIERDWDPRITRSVGDGPINLFVGDANNDKKNDIVTANYRDSTISLLLWNQTLEDWGPYVKKNVVNQPFSVFIGDANNDGLNDIAVGVTTGSFSMFLWNATLNDWNSELLLSSKGMSPESIFIEDANNDGWNDIVTSNLFSNDISILLWNHTENYWNPAILKSVGGEPMRVFVGDANNDGLNDILTVNRIDYNISIYLGNKTGGWEPEITKKTGDEPYSVFIGDANNDGYNDIVIANHWDDFTSIYLWNSTIDDWNPEIRRIVGPINEEPSGIFIGDANNDGQNDIITSSNYKDTISILLWKFKPGIPELDNILPVIDPDGIINLEWNDVNGADFYYVYRDTVNILNLEGRIPIAKAFLSEYNDVIYNNDTYYYAIVAGNTVGNSSISNCEEVEVAIIPGAVHIPKLFVEVIDQSFSTDEFIVNFYIYNETGNGIDSATIQMWWDAVTVPLNDISNVGGGRYSVSLSPITILAGDDPILLNMTISAIGYEEKYFETYLAVDPALIDKTVPQRPEIPGYSIFILLGTISVISIILFKKRLGK